MTRKSLYLPAIKERLSCCMKLKLNLILYRYKYKSSGIIPNRKNAGTGICRSRRFFTLNIRYFIKNMFFFISFLLCLSIFINHYLISEYNRSHRQEFFHRLFLGFLHVRFSNIQKFFPSFLPRQQK